MEYITFIVIGIFSRMLPHPANMTTLAGAALFTSATFGFRKSFIITFITMLLTDMLLGFHSVMWATYGCMLVTIGIGHIIRKQKSLAMGIGGILLSSILFFLITNFAVWLLPQSMYAKTVSGLIECYVMALPFFRNTVIGDLVYSGLFFGGYALVKSIKEKYVVHQINS